jgi:hypothetical protein
MTNLIGCKSQRSGSSLPSWSNSKKNLCSKMRVADRRTTQNKQRFEHLGLKRVSPRGAASGASSARGCLPVDYGWTLPASQF